MHIRSGQTVALEPAPTRGYAHAMLYARVWLLSGVTEDWRRRLVRFVRAVGRPVCSVRVAGRTARSVVRVAPVNEDYDIHFRLIPAPTSWNTFRLVSLALGGRLRAHPGVL